MPKTPERLLSDLFLATFTLLVVLDGGVSYLASAISLLLFGILLYLSASVQFHRPLLHRLRLTAIVGAVLLAATAVLQILWDPTGISANPIWQHLNEQFGETGGVRAVMRLQPIWELPGIIIPFFSFAIAITLYRSEKESRFLWQYISIIGGLFAFYGILQNATFPTWHFGERTAYIDSVTGFYVNRNVAAGFLILTSLATLVCLDYVLQNVDPRHLHRVAVGLARPHPGDRRLLLFASLLLLQITALFLTKSRAGSAIGAAALVAHLAMHFRSHFDAWRIRPTRRTVLITTAILLGIASLLAARVSQRYDLQGFDDSRWCAYPAMMKMAYENMPWGVGFGGFVTSYAGYRLPDCGIIGVWDSAHDGYIQGVATMGIVFPAILAIVIGALLPPLLRARRQGVQSRASADAVLLGALALALHSIVDFPLEIPSNSVLLAILAASTIGMSTKHRRRIGGQNAGTTQ